MKTLLAILALCSALKVSAVPIFYFNYSQGQNGWQLSITSDVIDDGVYLGHQLYINDAPRNVPGHMHQSAGVLLFDPLQFPYIYGVNEVRAVLPSGQTFYSSFILYEPTGPRPEGTASIPDAGGSLLLLGFGLLAVGVVRRHSKV